LYAATLKKYAYIYCTRTAQTKYEYRFIVVILDTQAGPYAFENEEEVTLQIIPLLASYNSERNSVQGSGLYTPQEHENEPPCIAQDAGVNCDKLVGITVR